MKLLFVTHWANNMLIFRTWMLQDAVRRGHEVLVLCPADPEAERFAALGVRHVPWVLQRGGGIINMLRAIRDARRILRLEKPDRTVVYCVQPILAILAAWKWGGRHGRLFPTFTGLGSLWTDLDAPSLKKRLLRWSVERLFGCWLPMSAAVFVLNRDDKQQVAAWNPRKLQAVAGMSGADACVSAQKAAKVPVIQTRGEGVDTAFFRVPTAEEKTAARERWGFAPEVKVVGFAGRLIREKGARDFLRLCSALSQKDGYAFLVVGDPDPGNPTSLSAQELDALEKIPALRREPWMDDMRPAYAAMDVLVFPSQYREGLPMVPQEAMAMGVPVVGYDTVGTREVVPMEWIVGPGNLDSLMRILCSLLHDSMPTQTVVVQAVRRLGRPTIQGTFLDALKLEN